MQMAAVFGFAQHLASLGEDGLRNLGWTIDGAFFRKKLQFVPVLPCLQRLAAGIIGESDAKALIDVKADNLNPRSAREVRPFLPERSVRRVVILADAQLFYRPFAPSQDVVDDFA